INLFINSLKISHNNTGQIKINLVFAEVESMRRLSGYYRRTGARVGCSKRTSASGSDRQPNAANARPLDNVRPRLIWGALVSGKHIKEKMHDEYHRNHHA